MSTRIAVIIRMSPSVKARNPAALQRASREILCQRAAFLLPKLRRPLPTRKRTSAQWLRARTDCRSLLTNLPMEALARMRSKCRRTDGLGRGPGTGRGNGVTCGGVGFTPSLSALGSVTASFSEGPAGLAEDEEWVAASASP